MYIPILPRQLIDYIAAPTPIIMVISSFNSKPYLTSFVRVFTPVAWKKLQHKLMKYFNTNLCILTCWKCVVVDLDNNKVTVPSAALHLPKYLETQLR